MADVKSRMQPASGVQENIIQVYYDQFLLFQKGNKLFHALADSRSKAKLNFKSTGRSTIKEMV